jgi:class 3 adenylate cyclase
MSETTEDDKFEFLAGFRADIVGYTNTDEESIIRIKQQIFSESIIKCRTYHELINDVHFEERAGDDIIIIVPTSKIVKLIHFAEELTENLVNESQFKREQREEFIDDVKVRIGFHVGSAFVKKDISNNKFISITGNIMNYLKRVTDIGSSGDILLTEGAVNTIFALTTQYKGNLFAAGRYPIKHGKYLHIWYYKNGNTGNPTPPPRKKLPLIKHLTKRNYLLALSLIIISGLGFSLGLVVLLDNNNTTELNNIKTIIQNEIQDKYLKLIQDKKLIENILQQKVDEININQQQQIALSTTLTPQLKNELNSMLTEISEDNGIKYSWISKIKPELCTITLYKPYDRDFINTTDFRKKPWCNDLNYYDTYLTATYYASGPHDFVNTLVSEINIKLPDGKSKTIGYLGKALEWSDIIPTLLASNSKPRLILVDNEGYIAFDCTFLGCKDLDNYRSTVIDQKPLVFNSSYIGNLFALSFSFEKVNMENKLGNNSNIFDNWTLYIQSDKFYEIMDYLIFGSISVMFGLIIYYYLIPRHWLEELR